MRKVSAKCNKKITSPSGNSDLVEQTKSDYQVISQTEADLSEYKRSFNNQKALGNGAAHERPTRATFIENNRITGEATGERISHSLRDSERRKDPHTSNYLQPTGAPHLGLQMMLKALL